MRKPNEIFRNPSLGGDDVICPPEQVFQSSDFDFLITIGGHLYKSEEEYNRFLILLKEIGENKYYFYENIGAIITSRDTPFQKKILLNSTTKDFDEVSKEFDEHFGLMTSHFFIYGDTNEWGIYLAEYPTINIIGCKPYLKNRFRQVFGINGNGFKDIEEFIEKEFSLSKDPQMISRFRENYRI